MTGSGPNAEPCNSLSYLIFLSMRFALTNFPKLLGHVVTEAVICVISVVGAITSCIKYQGASIS